MKCLTCANVDLHADRGMTRVGFGHCRLEEVGQFRGLERDRDCARHRPAEKDVVTQREAWAAERNSSRGEQA